MHAGTGWRTSWPKCAQLCAGGQAEPGRPGEAARRAGVGPVAEQDQQARSCRAPPGAWGPGRTAGRHPGRRDGRWSSNVAQWAWQIPSRSLITKKSRRDGARYRCSRIGSCSRDASCWRAPALRPAWPRSVRSRGAGRDGRPPRPVGDPPRPRRRLCSSYESLRVTAGLTSAGYRAYSQRAGPPRTCCRAGVEPAGHRHGSVGVHGRSTPAAAVHRRGRARQAGERRSDVGERDQALRPPRTEAGQSGGQIGP